MQKLEEVYGYNNFFPEVPQEVTDPGCWQTKLMGKWSSTSDHITVKEGRALVLAVKRLCRSSSTRGHRHLIFLDSFSLCMAVCKGRASSFKLLRVMQQLSALSLAGGFTVRVRWVPSERNVADAPSRGQIRPGAYSPPTCGEYGPDKVHQAEAQSKGPQFGCHKQECQIFGGDQSHEEVEGLSIDEGPPISQSSSSWKGETSKISGSDQGGDGRSQASSCREQADGSGAKASFEGDRESVCRLLPTIREFLPGRRLVPASQRCHRRQRDRVHGPDVLRGPKCSRRRKSSSKCGVSSLQAERSNDTIQKSFEGMEKGDASRVPNSNSKAHHLWDVHVDDEPWPSGDGNQADISRLRHLHEARREHGPEGEESYPPGQGSGSSAPVVLHCGERLRRQATRQGGHLRQFYPSKHTRSCLDRRDLASVSKDQSKQGDPAVQFCPRRVSTGAGSGECGFGTKIPPSLPAETWRCCRRSELRSEGSLECKSSRTVPDRCFSPSLHKSGQGATVDEPVVAKRHGVLSMVTAELGEGLQGSSETQDLLSGRCSENVLKSKRLPHRFALEVFAGTARVTRELCRAGVPAYPLDICIDGSHDVLQPDVEHKIFNWIRSHRISFLWCGMPCATFSRARKWDGKGPGPLRTWEHLWGIPYLSSHDQKKLNTGNQLFSFTLRLLRLCNQFRVPFVLENPKSSLAWSMPPMNKFRYKCSPQTIDLDYCQFGEPWRKPTKFLYNFIDLSSLALQCQPHNDRCSRSKRPHIRLTGLDERGIFWTLRAQPLSARADREDSSFGGPGPWLRDLGRREI